ncbi:MAG: hypothetical protein ACK452_13460 [Bacteroidota bacterium]|jgi:hypothetical protein
MKNKFKLTIAIIITCSLFSLNHAQSTCFQFHKFSCFPDGDKKSKESERGFIYDAQSRSGLFGTGEKNNKSQLRFVVYKGMDYRLTVCIDEEVLGETVQFIVRDAKTLELLFNNADEENTKQFEFSSAQTRALTVEVTIPAAEGGGDGKSKGKDSEGGCVGLLIEHKKSEKIGF